jgi:hypothetical protein
MANDVPLEDVPFISCEQHGSLMIQGTDCTELRPLQIEQARAAAKVVPGAI